MLTRVTVRVMMDNQEGLVVENTVVMADNICISNNNNGNNKLVKRPKYIAKAVTARVNIIKIKTTGLLGLV